MSLQRFNCVLGRKWRVYTNLGVNTLLIGKAKDGKGKKPPKKPTKATKGKGKPKEEEPKQAQTAEPEPEPAPEKEPTPPPVLPPVEDKAASDNESDKVKSVTYVEHHWIINVLWSQKKFNILVGAMTVLKKDIWHCY